MQEQPERANERAKGLGNHVFLTGGGVGTSGDLVGTWVGARVKTGLEACGSSERT